MHVLRGCCLAIKAWEDQWSNRVWFCGCVLLNFKIIVWNTIGLIDWLSWLERGWGALGFFWPQQRSRLGVGGRGNQVWTWWGRKSLCFCLPPTHPLHAPDFIDFLVCSHIPMKACIFIRWLPFLLCFVCIHLWIQKREKWLCLYGRNSFLLSLISCLEIEGPGRWCSCKQASEEEKEEI